MDFNILGPLEVRADERDVTCKGAKQRLLLSVLLLNANHVVSNDRLIEVLWGDDPPETTKALQMHVSQLRKLLEPGLLVTRPPGYELRVAPHDVDLYRFEAAVGEGRAALAAGRTSDARRLLRGALALWRGPAFADLTFEDCLQSEIARLEELRLAALEARIEADLALGNHADVIAELEHLAAAHPTRERIRAHLMLALYRSGRQADALEVYRDARRALVDELGIEPSRHLQVIERQILAQDPGLDLAKPDRTQTLLGRERELAELTGVVDRALAGHGALLLLGGEPGIGKSRLAEALAAHARGRGARVLVGRCWEAGGAPAYWPWVQALRTYLRNLRPEELHEQVGRGGPELTALFPELADLLPAGTTTVAPDSEGARFRVFEAVGTLLANAAAAAPLVLFLDDVHAADQPSLLLLRFLAAQLSGTPLLISCCYRDTEGDAELDAALTDLTREPVTHRLALSGLDKRATARLLEASMGGAPDAGLLNQIHDGTRGNPLFVAELGRLLAGGEWRDGPLPIPEGIRETIARRLERQSPECRAALETASAFGREFELGPLGQVSGLSESELLAVIDEATAARFVGVVPGSTERLRFSHVLMRDALYDRLSGSRRMALHHQIAGALEQRHAAELDRHASEIAHHYLHGGSAVAEPAIAYATRAGDHAASQHGHEEAARHYAAALDVLEAVAPDDDARACDLLLALADVQSRAGDTEAAKAPFERAAAIAEQQQWPDRLTRAVLGYGGRFVWGRASVDPELVPMLNRALAVVGEEDSPARVQLLARLAAARRDEAAQAPRERLAAEAVAIARRIGDPGTIAYALDGQSTAIEGPTAAQSGCLSRAAEQIGLAREAGNIEIVFEGHDSRLRTFWMLADRAGVEVEAAAMTVIAEELRQPPHRWNVRTVEVQLALMEGRFADAEAAIDDVHELGRRALPWSSAVTHRIELFVLRHAQGRLAEIEDLINRAVHEYPALLRFACIYAHLHAALGHGREAHETVARVLAHDLEHEYRDHEWLFAMSVLADPCATLEGGASGKLYGLLLPYERLYAEAPVEGTFGSIARALGVLAVQMRQFEAAVRHFEHAIEIERAMHARPWVAHAQHGLGEAFLALGDDARARVALDQAIAGYRELGMESWAARAAAL